jgi:hypothetical protein
MSGPLTPGYSTRHVLGIFLHCIINRGAYCWGPAYKVRVPKRKRVDQLSRCANLEWSVPFARVGRSCPTLDYHSSETEQGHFHISHLPKSRKMNSEFQGASWTLCSSRYLAQDCTSKPSVSLQNARPWTTSTGTNQHFGLYRKRHFSTTVHTFSEVSWNFLPSSSVLQSVGVSAWGLINERNLSPIQFRFYPWYLHGEVLFPPATEAGTGRRNACRNACRDRGQSGCFG